MSKIAIVSDSTSFLPTELVTKYNLTITPLVVIWDEKNFHDGVDIHPTDFYTRLKTVTSRWPAGRKGGSDFVMPTMK